MSDKNQTMKGFRKILVERIKSCSDDGLIVQWMHYLNAHSISFSIPRLLSHCHVPYEYIDHFIVQFEWGRAQFYSVDDVPPHSNILPMWSICIIITREAQVFRQHEKSAEAISQN